MLLYSIGAGGEGDQESLEPVAGPEIREPHAGGPGLLPGVHAGEFWIRQDVCFNAVLLLEMCWAPLSPWPVWSTGAYVARGASFEVLLALQQPGISAPAKFCVSHLGAGSG